MSADSFKSDGLAGQTRSKICSVRSIGAHNSTGVCFEKNLFIGLNTPLS